MGSSSRWPRIEIAAELRPVGAGLRAADVELPVMTKQTLTRRELARRALAGAAGALLTPALASAVSAQVVDPIPTAPPPLPATPIDAKPVEAKPMNEGDLLTQLVPINVGYTLSDAQAKEVAQQLKDYPGSFAKARAYVLPDEIGPAFAADAPARKERIK